MKYLVLTLLLAACGRIDFDPLAGGGGGGDGDANDATVLPPNAVARQVAGGLNTCVLLGSGDVWCWGAAQNNGTGDTTTNTGVPRRVATTARIVSLETSDAGACGILADHTAVCWGRNDLGQLGVGTVGVVATPQPIVGENAIAEISIGYYASCLRRLDGSIACSGQANLLGTATMTDSSTFQTVPDFGPASTLGPAIGVTAGDQHMCVLLASGAVSCWGVNTADQLGNGVQIASFVPSMGPVGPYSKIAAGDNHNCALRGSTVECWGQNSTGELGDNSQTTRAAAAPVMNLTDATDVVGLAETSCALRAGGTVACWGQNMQGAVGDGTTTGMHLTKFDLPLTGVTQISARTSRHVCAAQSNVVSCWGGNSNGQLGNGSVGGSSGVPTPVTGLP